MKYKEKNQRRIKKESNKETEENGSKNERY